MTKFIEAHILQTLPPSNINRDGNGNPKTCEYGGVTRARVSSQAWKKAMRDYFRTIVDTSKLGIRSREFTGVIADRLGLPDDDEKLLKATGMLKKALGLPGKDKQRPGNTDALQFFGEPQWDTLARITREALASDDPEKYINAHRKEAKATLDADKSIDVALFGRMTASDEKNESSAYVVDAACQVAHAIGVNPSDIERDYLTGMDEHPGAKGAAMIDDSGFMSSTLYRYAVLDVDLLDRNLGHDPDAVREAVHAWLTAFIQSMPGGKKNAFAPETMPAFILADIRDTRPINLADAFQTPIAGDIIENAVAALTGHFGEMETVYGEPAPYLRVTANMHAANTLDMGMRENLVPLPQLIDDITGKAVED